MESKQKSFVVSVEGNIGSGKSTMLQFYSELEDVELHPGKTGYLKRRRPYSRAMMNIILCQSVQIRM